MKALPGFRNAVLFAVAIVAGLSPPAVTAEEASGLFIFVSDLHIGVGHSKLQGEPGNEIWSRLEDFRWSPEFDQFLHYVDAEGKHNATLVILGDALELWQSSSGKCQNGSGILECAISDCNPPAPDQACSVVDAKRRAEVVVREHDDVFKMLGWFANQGNKIVFVPGNHDAALLIPNVHNVVLRAISPRPIQGIEIATKGYWVSKDGLIWGEHGHQFDKVNSFVAWPNLSQSGGYLERPSGEGLVQEFYNQYEVMFPIVDNLTSEQAGIRLAISAGGLPGSAAALQRFAKFLFTKNSPRQLLSFLGKESEKSSAVSQKWKADVVRADNGIKTANVDRQDIGPVFIANSIIDDGLRKIALKGIATGEFVMTARDVTDETLVSFCDARAVRSQKEPETLQCPQEGGGHLGYVKDKILGLGDENLRQYLLNDIFPKTQALGFANKLKIFVYGHTHAYNHVSNFKVDPDWSLEVFNTGAFQRVADEDQLKMIMEDLCLEPSQALRVLRPENLPECYSYVRVDYRKDRPVPSLMFWSKQNGNWQPTASCVLERKKRCN